ncbi:DNA methyltransferase [Brevundimonas sp. G8]|uniref:class I SAM-dependent DNA methyltransferase n=1 Tax=Brevundimonas sp. G8 TaxID=1350776 RepID=UPI0012EF2453|nr:DNA methyltransferase [Brevundimonas sp. G8]VXB05046.1 conserved hypothetical protein [Brevundimonas sp. G8]
MIDQIAGGHFVDAEGFIQRWQSARGGAERANYQMFLTELCEALDLPRPAPASDDTRANDYVFERGVKRRESEGLASTLRIDLYKRGSFILEAKQSRAAHRPDGQATLFNADETVSTAASQGRWDILMRNARRQAEDYVFRLPADHAAPPFIIVCDVGYVFEVYADFSGSGRAYSHFPDRKRFRIQLEDLRDPEVVARLRDIWSDPHSLDPGRHAARVTRQIAERLAQVSKALEKKHPAEEVAQFLMRCIFTMFAEDADLLPRGQFTALLEECLDGPTSFAPLLQDLWRKMDAPEYADRFFSGFKTHLRYFNGGLFHDARAFPMGREEIGELLAASRHDWRYVEPAIFGTLVEQALDTTERRKLGAHYTPRAYVERLVEVTVMEPLRGDWADAQLKAGDARERGDLKEAVSIIRAFHHHLCNTRVLDPACGTGNFLYVSLELMKKLEGDVLEALAELGQSETIGFETVDPHQFLGIELNVRAAAIAELVLWIGYLQQHYRNRAEHPAEPILKAFGNIQQKDAVLTWDGYPELQFEMRDGVAVQVYPNARRPDWPEAEFIVGNPPFIGNKRMKEQLSEKYVRALRRTWENVTESADFVMYWWARAADLAAIGAIRRFGLVTTNSITMAFNRSVMEDRLEAKFPISLIYAIPDHPWTEGDTTASVRIAMTVGAGGTFSGKVQQVENKRHGQAGSESLASATHGKITPFLTTGAMLSAAKPLKADQGLSFMGVIPVSLRFVLSKNETELIENANSSVLREYLSGKDLADNRTSRRIIDFFGMSETDARQNHPALFQHVIDHVKPFRDTVVRKNHRVNWWIFGEARPGMRNALAGIPRYIATTETSKHRWFTFLGHSILPDQKIRVIASDQAWLLAMLSSTFHVHWATAIGGRVGKGNDPVYNNTLCFDPFPFPDPSDAIRSTLRDLGEELDATRKTVQAEHSDLTLTGLYNVLEKVRAGTALDAKDEDVKARGRVLILKDLHDQIDRATADAYGWPHDLSDEQILERLVALNAERAAEEAAGHVRWLRPNYQIPRFAKAASKTSGALDLGDNVVAFDRSLPAFPKDKSEQPLAIRAVLERSGHAMDATEIARAFKAGGKRIEPRVIQALYTLVRYGWITPLSDGRFAARRAA